MARPDDADQLKLDLEDANLRLEKVRKAVLARDEAAARVEELTQALKVAKRRLKEAGWQMSSLLGSVKQERKGK